MKSWARTDPLPKMTTDDVRRQLGRYGRRAWLHLALLRRPVPVAHYALADDTLRRLVRRGLVFVIPYLGVDHFVNHGAVNAMLRGE